MNRIVVDLRSVNTSSGVLEKIGEALELGGPGGNVPVGSISQGYGWGMNWNALADTLTCLDAGGIWGTSRKMEFPLQLDLIRCKSFHEACPEEYGILLEILADTRRLYAKSSHDFVYTITDY